MKTLIVLVAVLWGILAAVEPALAQCSTSTVFLPDGRVMMCTTCTHSGQSTTTCM